ncbi:hypothetical protein COU62_01930 [Candidatus Pacearchaeota archaeon CG10_big_fil_rev_8_21_14_0_10_35_219]|nr:hypothetical protein [Candidatus Pacearchaeota archaeon]OIO42536.1 MAG: hypothetical protein AUJ63_02530 [Candidatus Pacearchaeota archaeon CG1_02_35_32]PIO07951.1 MAG: hypothetical protein COU62_01930 [Candidatus Pacearchaeota archaeon CG10_big_fil_rev_8_21_14_0_10_35_219]PIY81406.1 MAG: hypothetical protein COY79_02740 [Candidatus Pacearchaeota archaeon CG_4_10_14_0_8_um_filter_35_169]PIZ80630.1 MAG: hypothetical protein COY00_00705 [Candidatus Pacearchaeota archaeon CG_4_10_14_0_2_um_filt
MFSSNMCTVCNESISDPVCRCCYIRQIETILNDLNLHELIEEVILNEVKNRFPEGTLNNTECILCRKDNVVICRYCFSIILTGILRELCFSEEMIENFGYNEIYEGNVFQK